MESLRCQLPKPHDEMKLSKLKTDSAKSPDNRAPRKISAYEGDGRHARSWHGQIVRCGPLIEAA